MRESTALSTLYRPARMRARAEVAELVDAPDSKSGGAQASCGFDSHLRHTRNASRNPHRRRRLPGPERGHPRRGSAVARPRVRGRRRPRRAGAASSTASFEPLGPREISGLLPRGGTIIGTTRTNPYKVEGGVDRVLENFERAEPRRARRDRRRGHARRRGAAPSRSTASRSSASRRRSTTTSPRPTTRSASTRRSRSAPRRSTGCTRPPSRTTASWSSRSWAGTRAGSPS